MTNVTIQINNVDINKLVDIESYFKNFKNVTITTNKPWPKMEVGDGFIYNGDEYVFLSYSNKDFSKCKCILRTTLSDNNSYMHGVYFSCDKTQSNIRFL